MHHWTDDDGRTHVVHSRHRPPNLLAFGYDSLCGEHIVPREGDHFEFDVDQDDQMCTDCLSIDSKNRSTQEEEVTWNGHRLGVVRDRHGRVTRVTAYCDRRPFDQILGFEPPEFDGDLHTEVETVCEECWAIYKERQWRERDGGGEVAVTIMADTGAETYYATSISVVGSGHQLKLRSVDGLTKTISQEQMVDLSFTEPRRVIY